MNVTEVFVGRCITLHELPEGTFEADSATPFELSAVFKRLYGEALNDDQIDSSSSTLEVAILFQNTFNENFDLQWINEATDGVNERVIDGEENLSRLYIICEELTAAYGREYAFTKSPHRYQYDAAKWYTMISASWCYHKLQDARKATAEWTRGKHNWLESDTETFLNRVRNAVSEVIKPGK